MRAIRQTQFGGPDILVVTAVDDPQPAAGDILVRLKASGINPVDVYARSGGFQPLGQPPFILGWDVAGVVEAVNGTADFAVGDEVFGMPLFPKAAGAYAELVAAPAHDFARKPQSWSYEQAAAAPLAGLTAWQGLIDGAALKAGERVLIHGGGGGVGHLAVQLAKAQGAYVIATASAGKRDFVLGLGADEVIDYRTTRFEDAAGAVEVILDTVGGDNGTRSVALLQRGGRFATIVERTNAALAEAAERKGVTFIGVGVRPDKIGLEAMAKLADAGKLTPIIAAVFPLEQAGAAHLALAAKPAGKIVLAI